MTWLVVLVASCGASLFPALAYLWFVWWMDRYDREPLWLVAAAFFWGAVGAVTLSVLGTLVLALPIYALGDPAVAKGLETALVAPLVEEFFKGGMLLVLALHRKFDGFVDGVVYGAAAGLGFAATENVLYYVGAFAQGGFGGWVGTVLVRTSCSTLMHAVATGATGGAIGLAKFAVAPALRWLAPPVGLACAISIHGFFNGALVLLQSSEQPAFFLLDVLVLFAELSVGFVLVQAGLVHESRVIRSELEEEVRLGTITPAHLDVVPSYWRRLELTLPRLLGGAGRGSYAAARDFLQAASELALRKRQARVCTGERREALLEDVRRLREQVVLVRGGARSGLA